MLTDPGLVPHYRVVTLFPDMFLPLTHCGVVGRAFQRGLWRLSCYNPRDHAQDRHRRVDDRPFGGGAGMVMLAEPLSKALRAAVEEAHHASSPIVYLSPQGRVLTQEKCLALSQCPSIIFLSGRYEGIDERVVDRYVTEEISLGDYILTGGDLAAMVVLDAIIRLLPGCVGDSSSLDQESFVGGLLDWPHYTRPVVFDGAPVPPVLLSGHHARIAQWRLQQAIGRTWLRRPDLIRARGLNAAEKDLLHRFLVDNGRWNDCDEGLGD